jgi:hypothetical protein
MPAAHRNTASLVIIGVAGLLLALSAGAASVYAQPASVFTPTGNMTAARENHTATLLPNGNVLVVGGFDSSSAELYDPVMGTWSTTGNLNIPRFWHTATLLQNGKVLVVGGDSHGMSLSSAELYDPTTGTWSVTGSMHEGRWSHTATLLPNGKVLVTGGSPSLFNATSSTELYDPTIETWRATSSLSNQRFGHTATLLPSGKVLVAGGDEGNVDPASINSAQLYDTSTETWSLTSSLNTGRYWHTATLLSSGKVMIAGGLGGGSGKAFSTLDSAELYGSASLVPVVTDLQFDRMNAIAGSSYSVNVSGSNLTSQTFFDVRFLSPGGNEPAVVLNWQKGLAAKHDIPAGTASGVWAINGVRAHEIETDHTGSFVQLSATITIVP